MLGVRLRVNLINFLQYVYRRCAQHQQEINAMTVSWGNACGSSTAANKGGSPIFFNLLERPAGKNTNSNKKTTDSHRVGRRANPPRCCRGRRTRWSKKRANPFTSCRGNCLQAHIISFLRTLTGRETAAAAIIVAAVFSPTALG